MHLHIKEAVLRYAIGAALPERDESDVTRALTPLVGRRSAMKMIATVGLLGLARRSADDLVTESGVTPATAKRVVAARDFGEVLSRPREKLTLPNRILQMLPLGYTRFEREVMTSIVLNNELERLATVLIAAGGTQVVCLAAVDVLRPVLRIGGNAFVLVHNHPSGAPTPSQADVHFTNRIAKAAELVGVQLVDHIIIAEGGTFSFYESGLMPTAEELEGKVPDA